jgi:hypothetical protein
VFVGRFNFRNGPLKTAMVYATKPSESGGITIMMHLASHHRFTRSAPTIMERGGAHVQQLSTTEHSNSSNATAAANSPSPAVSNGCCRRWSSLYTTIITESMLRKPPYRLVHLSDSTAT